ncbi:Uncharacterised protein g3848 [Pycnogonum litorale]
MKLFLYLSFLISVFRTVFSSHLWYVQDTTTQVRCILLKATITETGPQTKETNFEQAEVTYASKCGKQTQIMEILKPQKSNIASIIRFTFTKNGKEINLNRVDFEITQSGATQASTSIYAGEMSDFHFLLGTSLTTKQTIELTADHFSIKIKDIQVEAFRTGKDSKFDNNAASSLMISMNILLAVSTSCWVHL